MGMFKEFDSVRTTVAITLGDKHWPVGTEGTIVDLTGDEAIVEVDPETLGEDHWILHASTDQLVSVSDTSIGSGSGKRAA